jgi:hypothetical protein
MKIIVSLILILALALVYMFVINPSKPLPITFDSVTKIEMYHVDNNEFKKLIVIEKKEDISNVNKIVRNVKGGWKDIPACPFGVSMIFYDGDKKVSIMIGTDSCGLIEYNEKYYSLPENDIEPLQLLIEKLTGISFDKLRF